MKSSRAKTSHRLVLPFALLTLTSVSQAQEISTSVENVLPKATVTRGSRSEYFFRPGTQNWMIEVSPTFQKTVERDSYTVDTSQTQIKSAYGFSDKLAASISTSFGESDLKPAKSDNKSYVGLSDIIFNLQGNSKKGSSLVIPYGLRLNLSPTANLQAEGKSSGNRFSGSQGLEPYAGVEVKPSRSVVYGSELGYHFVSDRRYRPFDGADVRTERGGNTTRLSFFAEMNLADGDRIGLSDSISNTEDITSERGSVIASGYQFNSTRLYGNFDFEAFQLIPSIAYGTRFVNDSNPQHIDSTAVGLGFRAVF